MWDGATGELICADAQQSPEKIAGVKPEVTSMCLGTEGRRTIVGDDSGRIKVGIEKLEPSRSVDVTYCDVKVRFAKNVMCLRGNRYVHQHLFPCLLSCFCLRLAVRLSVFVFSLNLFPLH